MNKCLGILFLAGTLMATMPLSSASSSAAANEPKENVLTYFYKLYPLGSGKPVDQMSFQEKDIKNGYLQVTGAMEGYYIFALFRGPKAHWLIQQGSECGPACNQNFKAYKFVNGKLETTKKFESLYPKDQVDKHVAKLIKKLPKGPTDEDLQVWLRLPKTGTSIDILILEQNPGHVSGKSQVYEAGRLNWDGSRFNFKKLDAVKASSMDMAEVR